MKILQISSATSVGGGERHLADLANGLASRGHDVFVALRRNAALRAELAHVKSQNICELPLRNSLDVFSARELAKLVQRNEIDIVHAHMARDYPLAAYAIRKNRRARLILTRHVLFPLNRLHRLTFSRAARIIAVSPAVASQLRADKVTAPEKIAVVLNGIKARRFAALREKFDRQKLLKQLNFPEQALIVGTVGELTPLKGHEDFLRAMAKVAAEISNCYFIIAGIDHSLDQGYRKTLDYLVQELNLVERVRRLDWLDDIAELYCALDVFVSASHTESFGLAIAEAMASRTAVVATHTKGAQEIIRPGETGQLVGIGNTCELATAVKLLLKDEQRRNDIAAAGQRDVSDRFSLERMIEETEEIYRTCLG